MSENTNTAAVETAPVAEVAAAPKKKVAKKAAKVAGAKGTKKAAKTAKTAKAAKAAKKAPATKKVAKKAPAAAGTPKAKKDGLRKPQVRVLKALAKANKALSRSEIAAKAEVDQAMLTEYIGSDNPEIRAKNDERVCKSLLTLGYVKHGPAEDESGTVRYVIAANGKKALEKLS